MDGARARPLRAMDREAGWLNRNGRGLPPLGKGAQHLWRGYHRFVHPGFGLRFAASY
jgi:hypothetical protein